MIASLGTGATKAILRALVTDAATTGAAAVRKYEPTTRARGEHHDQSIRGPGGAPDHRPGGRASRGVPDQGADRHPGRAGHQPGDLPGRAAPALPGRPGRPG